MRLLLTAAALMILAVGQPAAQDIPPADSVKVDSVEADSAIADSATTPEKIDTVLYRPKINVTEANSVSNPTNYEDHLVQQPTIGLLKSALLPGWGQVGNHRYVKAGVFAGFQLWFVSAALHYGSAAADYRDNWNEATEPFARNEWYGLYQDHRDDRNKYTWFAVINSFVAMFDAYVDAHLSGSPDKQEGKSLSFDVVPDEEFGSRAVLTYRF